MQVVMLGPAAAPAGAGGGGSVLLLCTVVIIYISDVLCLVKSGQEFVTSVAQGRL
jgi:hypothetical protein